MQVLDPRIHAIRPDLADERLRGKHEAERFANGQTLQVQVPIAPVLKRPAPESSQTSQCLMGETCEAFEDQNGWSWVQLTRDGYVGYVESDALASTIVKPTHKVIATSTLIYPRADLKSHPGKLIVANAEICVVGGDGTYAELANGGFVFAAHVAPLTYQEKDFVAVAERFLNVPYYWGGKSVLGIDCSGLVQISLQACGIAAPRDSDMQERELGVPVKDSRHLQRGDLVFWAGHVGIMQSATQLLHANGHFMKTTSELLAHVVARSEASGQPITKIKRLAGT